MKNYYYLFITILGKVKIRIEHLKEQLSYQKQLVEKKIIP